MGLRIGSLGDSWDENWLGRKVYDSFLYHYVIDVIACPFRDERICSYLYALAEMNRYDDLPGSHASLVLLGALLNGWDLDISGGREFSHYMVKCFSRYIAVIGVRVDGSDWFYADAPHFLYCHPWFKTMLGGLAAANVIRTGRDVFLQALAAGPDNIVKTYDYGSDLIMFRLTYAKWFLELRVNVLGEVSLAVMRGAFPETLNQLVSSGRLLPDSTRYLYRVPPDELANLARLLLEFRREAYGGPGALTGYV